MKRVALFVLTFALALSIMYIQVSANETLDPRDSRNIPSELMTTIDREDTRVIFRYYNIAVRFAFNDCESIDDVLAYDENWDLFFQQTTDGVFFYELDDEGNYHKHEGWVVNFSERAIQEFQTGEALKAISSDIVLESVFYISGENSHMGTAIYYQTNLGDYVYYTEGNLCFSADVFFEYQKAVCAYSGKAKPDEVWDLSVYDYRSADFNPNTALARLEDPGYSRVLLYGGIGAGILLLACVITFIIIRRKKAG